MSAFERYTWRWLLRSLPRQLVRIYWETKRIPDDFMQLVGTEYSASVRPRRRLCKMELPAWWRPPLRCIEGGEA